MILALEGVEATGKSTITRLLCGGLVGNPSWRTYRALRRGDKWETGEAEEWQEAGGPANTFVEDVFAIDMIKKIGATNVIFDRSLPSGIVYNDLMWTSDGTLAPRAVKLLHWWSALMVESRGLLVYLHGDPMYLHEELAEYGRDIPVATLMKRHDRFVKCFNVCAMSGLEAVHYDTSVTDEMSVASRIGMKYLGGWQESLPLGGAGWASWT